MGNREIAEKFLAAVATLDLDAAAPYCADSFTYSGPLPKPVTLQEWRRVAAPFQRAFPDWSFNPQIVGEEGNLVNLTVQVTATHSGDLDLTGLDMGYIPATGKSIATPQTTGRVTFEGDKVANLHIEVVEGGGIPGILAQLGVEMP